MYIKDNFITCFAFVFLLTKIHYNTVCTHFFILIIDWFNYIIKFDLILTLLETSQKLNNGKNKLNQNSLLKLL